MQTFLFNRLSWIKKKYFLVTDYFREPIIFYSFLLSILKNKQVSAFYESKLQHV